MNNIIKVKRTIPRWQATIAKAKKIEIKNPSPIDMENLYLPMMKFSPKLLLTGSVVLSLLGLIGRTPHDIDFGLTESLTENELETIINFFNLRLRHEMLKQQVEYDSHGVATNLSEIIPTTKELLSKEMILLEKRINDNVDDDANIFGATIVKIDIFNKEYINTRDIIEIDHPTGNIRAVHPSIPISYKARYAFDPRVKTNMKHQEDLKDLLLNRENYFRIILK